MTDTKLPELPESVEFVVVEGDSRDMTCRSKEKLYTADQMHAYAAEALRQSQSLPAGAVAGWLEDWSMPGYAITRASVGPTPDPFPPKPGMTCTGTQPLYAALQADAREKGEAQSLSWLEQEVHALDCRHRGDPAYDHDAYWMKREVLKLIGKCQAIATQPAQESEKDGDADRLDFMVHRGAVIDCSYNDDKRTVYRAMAFGTPLTGWHLSYREAIDAAIAVSVKGHGNG